MRGAALAFVAGAWCLQQQARLPDMRTVVVVSVGTALLVVGAQWFGRRLESRFDSRSGRGTNSPLDPPLESPLKMPLELPLDSPLDSHVDSPPRPPLDSQRAHAESRPASRIGRGTASQPGCASTAAKHLVRIVFVLAACATGFCWAAWRAGDRLADTLPHALEGRDLVVVGTIATLPFVEDRGTRFEFTVESVVSRNSSGLPVAVPAHLALGWYRPMRDGPRHADASVPDLRPGQRWRLTVRLKRPHGAANPFGFDYEYWMLEEGLRASGYVRPGVDPVDPDEVDDADEATPVATPTSTRKLADFVWSANHVVERVRAHLRDRVLTVLADGGAIRVNAPYAGVIVALIVGDQRAIAQ